MIVPLDKITLLCLDADRHAAAEVLQELGLLHLEPLIPPVGDEIDALRRRQEQRGAARALLAGSDPAPGAAPALPPDAAVDRILALDAERRELERHLEALRAERRRWLPFGHFEPARLRALAQTGWNIRLFFVPGRALPPAPAQTHLVIFQQDNDGAHVALVGPADLPYAGEELPVPDRAPAELDREIADGEARLQALRAELGSLAALGPALIELEKSGKDQLDFLAACAGMGRRGAIALLRGYAPADALPALQQAARRHGWALIRATPGPDDNVPTLVRNPPWIRPVRFLFQLIGVVPGYREVDISAAFLGFYSLFFAMLVADAGYGAILLIGTLILRVRMKNIPRDLIRLLALLAGGTIVWGVLTGSYFGIAHLPAPLAALRVGWLTDETNLMRLCFLLGSIHLTLAHAWSLLRALPSLTALAQLGWIGLIWALYFLAGNMILGAALPAVVLPLSLASLGLIVLFMTPPRALKTEWHNHMMLPLSVIGAFGDVVSYVRLFAVGSAGTAISIAFNQMALAGGINSFGSGLSAALILFFAHTLNILLCALAVVVHGVRLNTLEFSGHLGMQWTGIPIKPFRRRPAGPDPVLD